jgi:hypothetical protein
MYFLLHWRIQDCSGILFADKNQRRIRNDSSHVNATYGIRMILLGKNPRVIPKHRYVRIIQTRLNMNFYFQASLKKRTLEAKYHWWVSNWIYRRRPRKHYKSMENIISSASVSIKKIQEYRLAYLQGFWKKKRIEEVPRSEYTYIQTSVHEFTFIHYTVLYKISILWRFNWMLSNVDKRFLAFHKNTFKLGVKICWGALIQ